MFRILTARRDSEARMPQPFPAAPAVTPHGLIAPLFADAARACRGLGVEPPRFTVDAAGCERIPLDPRLLRRALEPLVRRASAAAADQSGAGDAPSLREVVVTVVDMGAGVEIEVADSGPWLAEDVRRWLSGTASAACPAAADGSALAVAVAAARGFGGTLAAVNCPEGGVAITLRLPGSRSARVAA